MPFISKDWRSPGDEWVKTQQGWELKKVLEIYNSHGAITDDHYIVSSCQLQRPDSTSDSEDSDTGRLERTAILYGQPHCHITLKCTKQIAGFNDLGVVIKRLGMKHAVQDVRRFNYVCKLLDLLITLYLTKLSGQAQKVLFQLLEEVALEVRRSQQNLHILQKLLENLREVLLQYYCWGRPLGSTTLWKQHEVSISRINDIARTISIDEPEDEPRLQHVPEEMVREIMMRLTDHRDLESAAGAYHIAESLLTEQSLWKKLCKYHFTQQQVSYLFKQSKQMAIQRNWELIYHKLRKQFGLKEEYAETLTFCKNCNCLFWKTFGHPCIADSDPAYMDKLNKENVTVDSLYSSIPPQQFLQYFSF